MRTVFNLISGVLLVSATAFSGYAQTSATPKQTKVPLDAFKTASGKAIGAEGGYNEGDMFLVKVDPYFYPEVYGAVGKTGSTSMNASRWGQMYNSSSDGKIADFVLNKFAYSIWKLECIDTKQVETYRGGTNENKGKLYAYVHDVSVEEAPLSRFIFVERSKLAISNSNSGIYQYDPFKYIANNKSFLYSGTGYIEWSVSPADVEGGSDNSESTAHWVKAFNGKKSIETRLSEWSGPNDYGTFSFSHDCSNAVMRNHYMYMQAPTGYSWTNTSNFSTFSCNPAAGTEGQTILLYVPNHSENLVASAWQGDNEAATGPTYIKKIYRPYIQYFLAKLTGEHATEEVDGVEVNKENDQYCYHNLRWFDNVNDKFAVSDKIEEYELYVKSEIDGNVFKLYSFTDYAEGSNGTRTNARECLNIAHERRAFDYKVTYRVKAYIKGFGNKVCAQTEDIPLIVHGTGTAVLAVSDVQSKSVAKDNQSTKSGTNWITHTITVNPGASLRGVTTGKFTITHVANDGSKSGITESREIDASTIVWNADGTFSYTWTDANTYPYTGDGRGDDLYSVSYTPADATTPIAASEKPMEAPYYYADFGVQSVISEHKSNNEYYYVDQISITAESDNGQKSYEIRGTNANMWNPTTQQWGVTKSVNADSKTSVTVMESQTTSSNKVTNSYIGYIVFGEDKGVWGIGIGDIAHVFPELAAGPLVVETFPHNQVLDVELGALNEDAEDQTNYIWENPLIKGVHAGNKATTPQIFPGVDFKITVPRAKKPNVEGTGTETYYDVALALIIYDKNGNRVTAAGQEYFQSTVNGNAAPALIRKVGTENNYEFSFPQFGSRIAFTQENLVLTENVMFNFNEEDYTFDLFAIYLDDNKNAVAYRHTGYDQLHALETDADRNALYGTVAYAKNLPNVNSEKVIFETKVQTLQESSIKAKMLHEGGFAYLVLNMDEAIPTVAEKATVKEGSHTTDDLRNAITAYDVTVTQEGNDNMQVYTPKLAGAMTDNGEFKADWNWDLNSLQPTADACKNIKFNGLIHDNSNASDKLTVYAEHTNDDSSISFVQELRNDVTGEDVDDIETATIINSSNQNFMLIGVSKVDIPAKAKKVLRKEGDEGTQGTTTSTNALDKNLKITVQPIYTVASLNTPILGGVMKFIGQYIRYNRDDAKDNARVNAVPSANDTPVEEDYSTAANPEASLPQNIEEEIETNYPAESVISGAEIVGCDESKVYAEGLTIVVEGEAELVVVFDASAKQVYAGTEHRIEVAQPGVYVVATGGKIYKVFVK